MVVSSLLAAGALVLLGAAEAPAPAVYTEEIQPILDAHCVECHGVEKQKAGLRLDRFSLLQVGGDQGASFVAGDAEASLLYQVVAGLHEDISMPPKGDPLNAEQQAAIRDWINGGAEGPAEEAPLGERVVNSDHWAFQPIADPAPPADTDWSRNEIDRFVHAKLNAEGVAPAPEADKVTLLRRLHLDLLGLPPTPEEVEAFVNDDSAFAYEALVNRLLASPHFGERWGRHWLDLARYADSDGYEKDGMRPWAWRYRHWIIDALNRDMPYDQFATEQLAGDLLPNPTTEQLVATGFHRNTLTNKEGGVDQEEFRVKQVVDRVNTTGQVFMGLTMQCAECHTHKYDPITQREYFEFYAFFNSARETDIDAPLDEEVAFYKRELDTFNQKLSEVNNQVGERRKALEPAATRWADELEVEEIVWEVLQPEALDAGKGVTLEAREDGSIVASGETPDSDTYKIEFVSSAENINAIQIEALTDESLPGTGPGRAENGNFVLSGVTLEARRDFGDVEPAKNLARQGKASSRDDLGPDGGAGGNQAGIDGNYDTYYDKVDHWPLYRFRVDFEKERDVSALSIIGYEHHSFAPKDFKVLLDDEPVHEVKDAQYDNNVFVTTFPRGTCRSIELEITGYYGGSPAIREFGVYDDTAEAVWTRAARSAPVALAEPSADYTQANFDPAGVLDEDDKTGWAIGGKDLNQPRQLRVLTAMPVGSGHAMRYTLSLQQRYGGKHTLGRFRVLASSSPREHLAIPEDVLAAVNTPADERSDAHKASILDHYAASDPEMTQLRGRREGIEQARPQAPATKAQAMAPNPTPPVTQVHIRGDFLNKGAEVGPGTPAVLPAIDMGADGQPDRLDLARWIVSPENPLTARVRVNRVWGHLFGAGLVRTPEDFGTRGELPTHPELLDWLATDYMREGWSTKSLIRKIVTSSTYRQSSKYRPDLVERDPLNRLLARQNRFRVEAEIIRDLFLASSGLLNTAIGGPSVRPPLPDGFADLSYASSVKYPESQGEDKYRRGLYIWFQRTIAYPMLMTFDCPDSNVSTMARARSNTPLQALTLLNDPVFFEAAQGLGERIVSMEAETDDERIRGAFQLCFSREPSEVEVEMLANLLGAEREHYAANAEEAKALAGEGNEEAAPYITLARAMMNLDEFVTRE